MKTKRPRTERFKKSLAYLGPKKWNQLPKGVQHAASKTVFMNLVKNIVRVRSANEKNGQNEGII